MPDFDGNIDPAASWADVPQLSTTAPNLAGPGGPMNAQAVALAARTKLLYQRDTVTTLTSVAGVLTVNLALGKYFKTTLFENVTSVVITNPPAAGYGDSFMLWIKQDPTVARTFTFSTDLLRPAFGETLTMSTTLNSLSLLAGTYGYDAKWDATLTVRA